MVDKNYDLRVWGSSPTGTKGFYKVYIEILFSLRNFEVTCMQFKGLWSCF